MNSQRQPNHSADQPQAGTGAPVGNGGSATTALRMSERQRFQQRLARSTAGPTDWKSVLSAVGQTLSDACGSKFVATIRSGKTPAEAQLEGLTIPLDSVGVELRQRLALFGLSACRSQSTQVQPLQLQADGAGSTVVSVPLRHVETHFEALQLLHDFESDEHRDRIVSLVELSGGALREWLSNSVSLSLQARLDVATALVDLLARMDACDSIDDSSHVLVNCLSSHFAGATVVLGLCEDNTKVVKFQARSQDAHSADPSDEWVTRLESALQESLVRASLTVEPPFDPADRHSLLAHKRFLKEDDAASIVSSPLRDENGATVGAWGVLFNQPPAADSDVIRFFRAAETSVASSFNLVRRAQPGRFSQLLDKFSIARTSWKTRLALSAAVIGACLLLLPMDYNVKCDCELQPVRRRFVAAPFDGPLETSQVEPGDLVEKDQLLAKLDGREIRWELAGVQAEMSRASKERDGHRARQDFGAAQIAQYEMDRHKVRQQLLENRSHELEIRSPVDGIVIEGDWKKSEGIPLTLGQSMFEIAPLDKMVVEIGIPEEDIGYVEVGQSLAVSLDAVPGETWQGTVESIHPRAEVREQSHVYICEMSIDNTAGLLRPGMRGRAKIATVLRPLGWNLLHKPWNTFVMWLRYSI